MSEPGVGRARGRDGRCPRCAGAVESTWLVCGWCGGSLHDAAPVGVSPALAADAVVAPTAALAPGTGLVDRFRIDSVLGRGGFGITYRAEDLRLHRSVAIKELFPPAAARVGSAVAVEPTDRDGFEAARARFRREASSLARFNHPGIVRVFEVFEANNTAYLVMELVEGRSLLEVLGGRGGSFEVEEVLDVVLRVGRALEDVHAAGLLHRDVNPSNLMLDDSGRIVLIDFGLARRFGDEISGGVTRAVTPGYAPPEQYAGSARIGPSTDVYGLAATAYKLLTGVTPTNVFDRQAGVELVAPHVVRGDISGLVSNAVLDGMELTAEHRPATASALLDRFGLHGRTPGAKALIARGRMPADDRTLADRTRAQEPPSVSPVGFQDPAPRPASVRPPDLVDAPGPPVAPRVADGPPPQVLDLRAGGTPFAPWHDGSPPVVGPGSSWRGWVTFPVGAAVVARASAAPLIVGVVLALVALPAAATVGDLDVHRYRQSIGAERRNWHRASASSVAPLLFLRNLGMGLVRAVPAIAIGAIGVAVERAVAGSAIRGGWRNLTIRLCGASIALVLLIPSRHGGRSFRSDSGISAWAAWAMEGRERPGSRAMTIWVFALFALALGAWLRPDLWPLT